MPTRCRRNGTTFTVVDVPTDPFWSCGLSLAFWRQNDPEVRSDAQERGFAEFPDRRNLANSVLAVLFPKSPDHDLVVMWKDSK